MYRRTGRPRRTPDRQQPARQESEQTNEEHPGGSLTDACRPAGRAPVKEGGREPGSRSRLPSRATRALRKRGRRLGGSQGGAVPTEDAPGAQPARSTHYNVTSHENDSLSRRNALETPR